ncbi:matrixin family metalloprotease [Telluribacter sp.]|jgi:archaemetzincin|uniref:matrixin family metalloprotease n=1 Tax=Telluribacter sp. TaxID=1978767 RepID=UPI002E120A91|nr:matrixin family metalloprotease [Telluribacter sp.]
MKYAILIGLFALLVSFTGTPYKKIALQPFDGFDKALLDTVKLTIKDVYGYQVVVMEDIALPRQAFINVKFPRYRADSLIRFLRDKDYGSMDYVMGLTPMELSHTKKDAGGHVKKPAMKYIDWGVHGLGYCPGTSSVASTAKIESDEPSVFISRLKKICIHEFGHNLGLPHCPTDKCVMQDSAEKMSTIDDAELRLCNDCKDKLASIKQSP